MGFGKPRNTSVMDSTSDRDHSTDDTWLAYNSMFNPDCDLINDGIFTPEMQANFGNMVREREIAAEILGSSACTFISDSKLGSDPTNNHARTLDLGAASRNTVLAGETDANDMWLDDQMYVHDPYTHLRNDEISVPDIEPIFNIPVFEESLTTVNACLGNDAVALAFNVALDPTLISVFDANCESNYHAHFNAGSDLVFSRISTPQIEAISDHIMPNEKFTNIEPIRSQGLRPLFPRGDRCCTMENALLQSQADLRASGNESKQCKKRKRSLPPGSGTITFNEPRSTGEIGPVLTTRTKVACTYCRLRRKRCTGDRCTNLFEWMKSQTDVYFRELLREPIFKFNIFHDDIVSLVEMKELFDDLNPRDVGLAALKEFMSHYRSGQKIITRANAIHVFNQALGKRASVTISKLALHYTWQEVNVLFSLFDKVFNSSLRARAGDLNDYLIDLSNLGTHVLVMLDYVKAYEISETSASSIRESRNCIATYLKLCLEKFQPWASISPSHNYNEDKFWRPDWVIVPIQYITLWVSDEAWHRWLPHTSMQFLFDSIFGLTSANCLEGAKFTPSEGQMQEFATLWDVSGVEEYTYALSLGLILRTAPFSAMEIMKYSREDLVNTYGAFGLLDHENWVRMCRLKQLDLKYWDSRTLLFTKGRLVEQWLSIAVSLLVFSDASVVTALLEHGKTNGSMSQRSAFHSPSPMLQSAFRVWIACYIVILQGCDR